MNPESAPGSQQASLPSQPQPASQPTQNQSTVVAGTSSSKKPLLVIFVFILLLGIGAFYFFMVRQENSTTNVKPVSQIPPPVITAFPSATPIVDSSDTQLDKDIQAINDKANNLATDVNNVDKGLNDKPLDTGL